MEEISAAQCLLATGEGRPLSDKIVMCLACGLAKNTENDKTMGGPCYMGEGIAPLALAQCVDNRISDGSPVKMATPVLQQK